ncbi:MAG TPA: selenocysteine-specific translation elongation factor [Candidatus Binataceae bacterium]|nr:selenocysteine-specific translation elongation factor [Candidatus Binataceae bacterium]
MAANITHAIIGTAGHIDHGKTALIKALTGQDTDRLKEEKERGISIDLGFAYFTLPNGTRTGIVDVPGHERFIRNMLAGAHGIDLVLFAIAADDSVMPQSEEHLDILHLLGVRSGIFVITKADLVDAARLKEVRDEIELLADGTALQSAPVIAVSAITGAGMDELRAEIVRQLQGFESRRPTGIFRLPIDRAFAMKGHGAVVTGTAIGSEVNVGQKLRILPDNHEVRVRSIQVHGEPVERAGLCQRVALNLTGTEKFELRRGQVLADDQLDLVTRRIDVLLEIRPAAKRALKSNRRIRMFIGTTETLGRAIVLEDPTEIAPKARGLAQIVLDSPIIALAGDRFVIRDETNVRTVGGGIVLNPKGRESRKPLATYRANLNALASAEGPEAIEALLDLQDTLALTARDVAHLLNRPISEMARTLKDARFVKLSMGDEEGYTTTRKWEEIKRFALSALDQHHKSNPLSQGFEMEALRSRLPYEIDPRVFRNLIDRLSRETEIVREESMLRLKSHRVKLTTNENQLGARIEKHLEKAGFEPPELKQLVEDLKLPPDPGKIRELMNAMERDGKIVKIATDLYFARPVLDVAREKLTAYLGAQNEITAAAYRDLLGTSRKFAIALLDHFDRAGVTIRIGDARRLRLKVS